MKSSRSLGIFWENKRIFAKRARCWKRCAPAKGPFHETFLPMLDSGHAIWKLTGRKSQKFSGWEEKRYPQKFLFHFSMTIHIFFVSFRLSMTITSHIFESGEGGLAPHTLSWPHHCMQNSAQVEFQLHWLCILYTFGKRKSRWLPGKKSIVYQHFCLTKGRCLPKWGWVLKIFPTSGGLTPSGPCLVHLHSLPPHFETWPTLNSAW